MNKKELLIEITDKCPFNCLFCSSNSNIDRNQFIQTSDLFNIINDAEKVDITKIQLSGGEPFLHPQIEKIIDYLLNKNMSIDVYSCGTIYNKGKYLPLPKSILKKYKDNSQINFRFNFQTIKQDDFTELTKNPFGLKNLILTIKTCKKYNLNTEIHIIPLKINLNQLKPTIDYLLNTLKVSHIKILRFIPHGRAEKNIEKLMVEKFELFKKLIEIKKNFKDLVEIGTAFSIASNACNYCHAAINKFMVTNDLKLYPCTAFKNQDNSFIQINHKLTFKKIIKEDLLIKSLKAFYNYSKCNYCKNKFYCSEICPVQKEKCDSFVLTELAIPTFQKQVLY